MEPESEPRFPRVDALFAGGPPEAPDLVPSIRRLRWLLGLAIPLNAAGVLCWTGVPGAVLTLWAWLLSDEQAARVREGEVGPEQAEALMRLRGWSAWNLGLCVSSLLLQAALLTRTNLYEELLSRLVRWLG